MVGVIQCDIRVAAMSSIQVGIGQLIVRRLSVSMSTPKPHNELKSAFAITFESGVCRELRSLPNEIPSSEEN